MKCDQCGQKAVMLMRHHRLALCKEHYLSWFIDQTARVIEKYHMFAKEDRVVVAVSGGKDSLSLWDVLWRLGYAADGLYMDLGIQGENAYSTESHQYAQDFADERGLQLHVVDLVKTYGESTPAMARRTHRGQQRPCGVCGLAKRHIMNQVASDHGYNVLATGHNLDDEAAVLFGNTLSWSVDMLRRQQPVLEEGSGFARKAKPFCRFYERETAAYALLRGIEYIYEECPYAEGNKSLAYKALLNQMEEEKPGTKYNFYMSFLNARKNGLFAPEEHPEPPGELHRCPKCGQPTTSADLCAFCRMINPQIPV